MPVFFINNREIELIKQLFSELSAQNHIKIIYVSGSSARKTNVKSSDIDINVVYDDILYKDVQLGILIDTLNQIDTSAAKYGLKLHIQPPKSLSAFWELLRSEEPWILTEIDSAIPIHDTSDFIASLQTLLKRNQLYKKEERSSILIDRAKLGFAQAENAMYSEAINILTDTVVSNAQAVLMYFDRFVPYEELPKEMKALLKKDLIKEDEYAFFVNLLKIFKLHSNERKKYMIKHKVSLDNLIHSSTGFIERTEYLFELLEYLQKKDQVMHVYEETLELMKKTINHPIDKVIKDEKVILAFESAIQKKKYIPEAYLCTIRHIMEMKLKVDQKRFSELSSHEIHVSNATIKHLGKLINVDKYGSKRYA